MSSAMTSSTEPAAQCDQSLRNGSRPSDDDAILELHASTYGYLAAYTGLLVIFGVLTNGVIMALFVRFRSLRSPVNSLLFNLCLSDLFVAGIATPFTFASNVAGRWLFGDVGCTFYGFIVFVGGTEQIVILTMLSVHRCVLVTRPFLASKMTNTWAIFFIVLSWLYSLVISLPPLVGWNRYTYESPGTSCSLDWHSRNGSDISYIVFIFVGVLLVPLIIIISAYTILIRFVKKIAKSQAAQSIETKADRRATKMILLMVFFFLFAWLPYAVFSLYVSFAKDAQLGPVAATLPSFFAKLCVLFNPVIYFLMNKQFKDALSELIFRKRNPFNHANRENTMSMPKHVSAENNDCIASTTTSASIRTSKRVDFQMTSVLSSIASVTSILDLTHTPVSSPPVVREETEMAVKRSKYASKAASVSNASPMSPRPPCTTPSLQSPRIFELSSKFRCQRLAEKAEAVVAQVSPGLSSPTPSTMSNSMISSPLPGGKRNKVIPVPPLES